MVGIFEIKQGSAVIGQARVERQGLYYRIVCQCRPKETGMHRLTVCCGGKQEDLGTLIPMDGQFGLEKRIPVKRLGEGTPEFLLMCKNAVRKVNFAPVYPEEPFAYMTRLKNAYLERKEGQLGLAFRE